MLGQKLGPVEDWSSHGRVCRGCNCFLLSPFTRVTSPPASPFPDPKSQKNSAACADCFPQMKPTFIPPLNSVCVPFQAHSLLSKLGLRGENEGEVSNIWKQFNQRATFKWSHLRADPPSCLGVPAEPTANQSSGHPCHRLQAAREDALARNVQSMINLSLLIRMLLQLPQMFRSLLAVTDPCVVLTPYQASNDTSLRFPGLCQLDFMGFFLLWKVLHIFWDVSLWVVMCLNHASVLSHSSQG